MGLTFAKLFANDKDTGWADYADDYWTTGNRFSITGNTTYEIPINAQSGSRSQKPAYVDQFFVPTTITYTSETSPFTEGATLTEATSGETAIITHVEDNGSTGTLYLANTSGDFTGGLGLSDGSGGAATGGTFTRGGLTGRNGDAFLYTVDLEIAPTTATATYIDVWVDIGGAVGELYRRTVSFPKGQATHGFGRTTGAYTLDTWEANRGILYMRANANCEAWDFRVPVFNLHRAN